MKLCIVSGRSGAGKTIALRVLEDLGFYCIDNLPVVLIPDLINLNQYQYNNLAVSVDIRNLPVNPQGLIDFFADLKANPEHSIISIFLDADDNTLITRYEESRRIHPLSNGIRGGEQLSLEEAILAEHELLDPVAERSDIRLDTSHMSVHDLSNSISSLLLGKPGKELTMVFESFGFKRGIAKDADFVFDARFLPNPHWVPKLRAQTGLDQEVIDFFAEYPEVNEYISQIDTMISYWLPHLEKNNRSYVTVAIGCTGGQHRSVFIAESLAKRFIAKGRRVLIKHKNIKDANKK